ncbi:MAG: hypothetical protein CFE24_09095 [Flavobacterium sp. BFFFF2]|nr:MAG: hypothetical protein CFE24_09095 [Flavobacterium sp. BFFFF2]
METHLRAQFNAQFSTLKYEAVLESISNDFGYTPTFRLGETPFFIPEHLKDALIDGFNQVVDAILAPNFKEKTERALDLNIRVPGFEGKPHFLAVDFGICEEAGHIVPKLIEVQGFPSLFNFQSHLAAAFKKTYPDFGHLTPYFNGLTPETYMDEMRHLILGDSKPEQVILLEIEPHLQNTRIDFLYAERDFGIKIVCVTEVYEKENQLFYTSETGEPIRIERIYNRVIFDELNTRKDLNLRFDFTKNYDVYWVGHPNWFFRISKFILPFLKGPYFIDTQLVSDIKEWPTDLENYVLKPLFSFSGSGVIFHVTKADLEAVQDKDLYILQKKVHYAPIIQAPDGGVKAEVRLLAIWSEGAERPRLVTNLVRLSRGEMIGVKFNKDKTWVGGTFGLFEQ